MKKYELMEETMNQNNRILHRIRALRDFGKVKAGYPGGWIESEKNLSHDGDCWVWHNAKIYDNAQVSGNAQIYDNAWVCNNAKVCDNAQVCANSWVYNSAQISGSALLLDNAQVYNNAQVYDKAQITGGAHIFGHAKVYGNAQVFDDAVVYGRALVYGRAIVCHSAHVYGKASAYDFAKILGNSHVLDGKWGKAPLYIQGTRHSLSVASYSKLAIGCEIHPVKWWLEHYKETGEANGYTPDEIREYGYHIRYAAKWLERNT